MKYCMRKLRARMGIVMVLNNDGKISKHGNSVMTKKIAMIVQAILLAIFVQGCWAVDVNKKQGGVQVAESGSIGDSDNTMVEPSLQAIGRYMAVRVRMPNPIPGGLYPEICDAFLKNIEVIEGNHVPVSCQVKLNPALKEFSTPEWEDLDPAKYMHYVEMMVEYDAQFYVKVQGQKKMTEEERNAWYEREFKGRLEREKDRIKSGEFSKLQMAEFDYNNDGKSDFVIREKPPRICKELGATLWIPKLYLLTPDKKSIDEERMEQDLYQEVFFYKGQTFFYWANGFGSRFSISRPSTVTQRQDLYLQKVCSYKYETGNQ